MVPYGCKRRSGPQIKMVWLFAMIVVASRARELLPHPRVVNGPGGGIPTHACAGQRFTWLAGYGASGVWPCSSHHQIPRIRPIRRWRQKHSEKEANRCARIRMSVTEGGAARGAGGPTPSRKRPLLVLATRANDAILEMCVENKGRSLARAMTDFVEYTIEAFASGYSAEALLLELQFLDSTSRVPGQTLTGVEKRYRTQWIAAMHAVMQNLKYMDEQAPKSAEEFHIKSQVDVVLRGRQTNDEQTFVKFDKALATGGVSGGVATERIVISPQMVPISQLTLLAIRALQKMEDAAAA